MTKRELQAALAAAEAERERLQRLYDNERRLLHEALNALLAWNNLPPMKGGAE